MKQTEFTYLSSDGKITRSASVHSPEGSSRALLIILHDAAQTPASYEALSACLTEKGITTVCPFFAEYGSVSSPQERPHTARSANPHRIITEDLAIVRKEAAARFPDLPVYMLGTGTGSYLLLSFLTTHGEGLHGAVLAGSGFLSPASTSLKLYTIRALSSIRSDAYRSGILPRKVKLLSSSVSCNDTQIARLPKNLPLLLVSGADDPDGDFGAGVRRLQEKMLTSGISDITCIFYPQVKHDLMQPGHAEPYFADLVSFLDTHAGPEFLSSYAANKAYEEKKTQEQQEYEIEQILL